VLLCNITDHYRSHQTLHALQHDLAFEYYISQGTSSVVNDLRSGHRCNVQYYNFVANLQLSGPVKEFGKSQYLMQLSEKNWWLLFWTTM